MDCMVIALFKNDGVFDRNLFDSGTVLWNQLEWKELCGFVVVEYEWKDSFIRLEDTSILFNPCLRCVGSARPFSAPARVNYGKFLIRNGISDFRGPVASERC